MITRAGDKRSGRAGSTGRWPVIVAFFLLSILACPFVAAVGGIDAAAGPLAGADSMAVFARDTVSLDAFKFAHAFSLDDFLEGDLGYFLGRRGPIGAWTRLSRFGMGRGRAVVLLDGVPVNDPENGFAPLALVPTTSIGGLVLGRMGDGIMEAGIEGYLDIVPNDPPANRPSTAIELSKGSNEVKQRRVRFSSVRSSVGIDLAYDELLDGGYFYDARGEIKGEGFGSFAGRTYTLRLRGELPGDDGYVFTFRKFTSSSQGDLSGYRRSYSLGGHIATMGVDLSGLELLAFSREYRAVTPDSSSANETVGAMLGYTFSAGGNGSAGLKAGLENVRSEEKVGDAGASRGLNRFFVGSSLRRRLPALDVGISVGFEQQIDHANGWTASIELGKDLGSALRFEGFVTRASRLPYMGELFLPRHRSSQGDSVFIEGDENLEGEYALEGGGKIMGEWKKLRNEIKVSFLRVENPVVPFERSIPEGRLVTPGNGANESMHVVEEKFMYRDRVWGVDLDVAGGVLLAGGSRGRFLASVPEARITSTVGLGRNLFKNSSSIHLRADYQHAASRKVDDVEVAAFDLLDLKLDFRLLDAHFFMHFLNVLDRKYMTEWPYLMTPRTFVYGVEWTIFD
jgi:hypothetical protein